MTVELEGGSKFREDACFRILTLLRDQPDMSQRQIAQKLGISLGGVNYCIKGLIDKGLVKVGNLRKNTNKIKYAYLLTPDGFATKAAMTKRFLARRLGEYEALQAEIEALKGELSDEVGRER